MNSIETIQTRTSNYDWKNGPDQLCPADSTMSSQLSQPVRLRLTDLDKVKYPPISIYSMFQRTVKSKPDHDALAYKPTADSEWLKFSFEEYWKMCQKAAKSLIKLGLDTSQCVSILGFNSPQWFVSLLGTIFAGGVACGIYTTNSAEQIEYILRDSGSKIIIVENKQLLDKVINYKDRLGLKKIIQYSGTIENNHGGFVMAWKEFMEIGSNVHDSDLDLKIKTLAPNKCASLIYTSGTTGMPKAAMISHDNITYLVRYMADAANLKKFNERFISYLPLSNIAAQIVDIYCPLFIGGTVYFAQPDALKGSLNTTLKQVRPTFFFGVPRVWEKIQEGIEKNVKTLSGVKLNMFKWAQKVANETVMQRFNGRNSMLNPSWKLAKVLILNKVHAQLGLDECRAVYSGAAPITKETLEFFISLGIPLCETYGLSESTGPHSVGTVFSNRVTSVGPLRQCNQSKLGNKDADGSGELLVKGRHVFMGYLNDINKTLQTFDSDEWLQTGDIAKINDNFIYITGRSDLISNWSVVQVLFNIPDYVNKYFPNYDTYRQLTQQNPSEDFNFQLSKLSYGLLSGRYSQQNQSIKPQNFKNLVGKGNSEFSTKKQQDALEYLIVLFDLIERNLRRDTCNTNNPTEVFKFQLEDRLECAQSHKVSYKRRDDFFLSLPIAKDKPVNKKQLDEFEARKNELEKQGLKLEPGELVRPEIRLEDCLDLFSQNEVINDFYSTATKSKGDAIKSTRIATFPDYLVIQARKFDLAPDWTPIKFDVSLQVPDLIDLEKYKSTGLNPGEEELPEGDSEPEVVLNEELVSQLVDMGFSLDGSRRAVYNTREANNSEAAVNWAVMHMEDADFNSKFSIPSTGRPAKKSKTFDEETISNLISFGFNRPHVLKALEATDGNLERAADWLFNHPEDMETNSAEVSENTSQQNRLRDGCGKYELVAFISHMGSNANVGHYVAHIKKDNQWVIYNDEKVAKSENPPKDLAYLYFYKRI